MTRPRRPPTGARGCGPRGRERALAAPEGRGAVSQARIRQESDLERLLARSIELHGLPAPERELVFHPPRKWRIDFSWPRVRLAVEIEGGAFRGPGHRSVGVFLKNLEKYNQLTLDGWRLLRVTGDQVKSGAAVALIAQALGMTAPSAPARGEEE